MESLKRAQLIKRTVGRQIRRNSLPLSTLFGVFIGFAVGFTVREYSPSENTLLWIGLPGHLYLRMFKMLIVPLVMSTVICGAASLDPKSNGKISLIAFIFIVSSNAVSSALGIGFSILFKPAANVSRMNEDIVKGDLLTTDIFVDLIVVLATMAAMAIPSVPSASLVTALMVMTSLNIQIDDIALLLALEWIIDMIRMTCSVVSHTCCAATVYQFCKNDFESNVNVPDNGNNEQPTR